MTVKKLVQILKKSADANDVVLRQFTDKDDNIETEEISEITIKHYDNEQGCVEIW